MNNHLDHLDPPARYGMSIPFSGIPLSDHRARFEELTELGYTDLWSSESDGSDAFTPLALAAAWAPGMRLGTAVVPAFTRGPAVLAQSVAALADAAPGRFTFGIGTSSNVVVEGWNGIPFDLPYKRVRDTVRFLRLAMTGERVDFESDTVQVKGFRLARPPATLPPILIAALRPGMLRLAGRESDGTIINWLAATDVHKVISEVGMGRQIVARIFVCPSEDTDVVREQARKHIAAYLNVPVYAEFHRWLGRGPALEDMWDAWGRGDRKSALSAIPDQVVDDLILHGNPDVVRAKVAEYVAAGVTVPALSVLPFAGIDIEQAARDLAPR